jgi:quinolinate synthase
MELWPGTCIVHETYQDREITKLKMAHPNAPLIAHPECEAHILLMADFVGSTSALLRFAEKFEGEHLIVATEKGILHQMAKVASATLHAAPSSKGSCDACGECPHMRRNTPEKIAAALQRMAPAIEFEPELAEAARRPLDLMFELEA